MAKQKRSKNALRRDKAKLRKIGNDQANGVSQELVPGNGTVDTEHDTSPTPAKNGLHSPKQPDSVGEAVSEEIPVQDKELFRQFEGVFKVFHSNENESKPDESKYNNNDEIFYNSDSDGASLQDSSDEDDDEHKPLSKRQLRIRNKVPLALLKASTARPQIVEWYDADAEDPYFLVALKSQPNSIPVPGHWSSKREYLAGKRGIERLPFQLPKFIRDTGIMDMRNTDDQSIRQQQREKVQPKMGRLDIDYQRLHDAFFKHQNKPKLFGFGDVYFEGRETNDEYSDDVLKVKPGIVSSSLRKALGMPENTVSTPPPWIQIMNDVGKPPAYVNLIIPGIDVEYNNLGYKDKAYIPVKREEKWGALGEDEESEEEIDDDEDEDEANDGSEEEANEELEYEDDDEEEEESTKKDITEFGGVKTDFKPNPTSKSLPAQPKSLFTVLNELGQGYDLQGEGGNDQNEHTEKSSGEPDVSKDFKF